MSMYSVLRGVASYFVLAIALLLFTVPKPLKKYTGTGSSGQKS